MSILLTASTPIVKDSESNPIIFGNDGFVDVYFTIAAAIVDPSKVGLSSYYNRASLTITQYNQGDTGRGSGFVTVEMQLDTPSGPDTIRIIANFIDPPSNASGGVIFNDVTLPTALDWTILQGTLSIEPQVFGFVLQRTSRNPISCYYKVNNNYGYYGYAQIYLPLIEESIPLT